MNKLMGHNMMRKDGDAHMVERKAIFPAISPNTVKSHWTAQFQAHADRIIDALEPGGADLVTGFRPAVLGRVPQVDHGAHQHAFPRHGRMVAGMIDGIANYAGDPAIEARCRAATAGIDAAIDDMVPVLSKKPDRACSA